MVSAASSLLFVMLFSLLRQHARPSGPGTDDSRMARLCESGKELLISKAHELVSEAGGRPVLFHYSADGTPLATRQRVVAEVGRERRVSMQGRATEEYLVQHAFYRHIGLDEKSRTAVVLRDPLPLTNGKGVLACFSAALAYIVHPRDMGHHGICISHYTFDRALYTGMEKLFRKHHAHMNSLGQGAARNPHKTLQPLLDWVLSCGCALHDTQNALKWSMFQQFCDSEAMADIYIVMQSVINSSGLVLGHMGTWLQSVLVFSGEEELEPVEVMQELWTTLGCDPELTEALASELRLCWRDGRLRVAASLLEKGNVMDKVSGALLALWKFRTFSTSRWCSLGTPCRTFVAGLLTGLDSMVSHIRQDPASSDFHIHGYERLSPQKREFLVVAGLASYVPEAFLLELLEDSRIPMRLAAFQDCLQHEIQFLSKISLPAWSMLANVCEWSGPQLQSEVLSAAHTAIGFISTRVLTEAQKLPWALATGDLEQNLADLKEGPKPDERTAAKVRSLLQVGYNRELLKQGLMLMQDCPWSSASVEQQHASATVIKRLHPEYGQETLMVRAFLHSMRLLLPGLSPDEKKLKREGLRLQRLRATNPDKITGRHVYVQDLVSVGMAIKSSASSSAAPANMSQIILQKHGQSWQRMPATVKRKYEARAALERSASSHRLAESIEESQAKAQVLQSRLAEQGLQFRSPLLLSECKLSAADEALWDARLKSDAFVETHLQRLRADAKVAPPIIGQCLQEALAAVPLWENAITKARPSWLSPLCWGRDFFSKSALVFYDEDGNKNVYKLLYATQSPLAAYFSSLEPEDICLPMAPAGFHSWGPAAETYMDRAFRVDYMNAVPWHALPDARECEIGVLRQLAYKGGGVVASAADTVPLQTFLSWLPPKATKTHGAAKPSSSPADLQGILSKHPGLTKFLTKGSDPRPEPGKGTPDEDAAGSTEQIDDEQADAKAEDDKADSVFAELERQRQQWVGPDLAQPEEFKVKLSGGAYTKSQTGLACDRFQGTARSQPELEAWCRQYGFAKTASYQISVFGPKVASVFAQAWCHKMQYFRDICLTSGDPAYKYTTADLQAYTEPGEFALMAAALRGGQQLSRLQQFRALKPRGSGV